MASRRPSGAAPASSRRPVSSAPARSARPRAPRAVVAAPRARALRAGVLCALVVVCLVSVLAPLSAYVRQQSELAALGAEVEGAQGRVADLRTAAARWEDPAYVSAQARARLLYVMPGETGYRVLDALEPAAGQGGSAAVTGAVGADGRAAVPGDDGALPTEAGGAAAGAWYEALWGSVEAAGSS